MGNARQAVALLGSWVDDPAFVEHPDHSNCTRVSEDYGPIGNARCYAWCAACIWDVMRLISTPWPKTAQVLDLTNRAKRGEHGMTWHPKDTALAIGDVLPWDWKGNGSAGDMHVSMCKDPATQESFRTLGGNENDRVTDQWRDRTYLMGVIRPAYDPGGPVAFDTEQTKYLDTRVTNVVLAHVDPLATKLDNIAKKLEQGGTVDYDKLATAVADKLAARLKD